MPDKVIDKVNRIGKSERQGREFCFLNRSKEPYSWTDLVPEDDPEFQGLLEEEAPFPELSAQLPGVPLECDKDDEVFEVVTDKPEPDFDNLAAAALDNAGIDTGDRLGAARAAAGAAAPNGPCIVEAEPDKIMYDITFDLPDAGLIPGAIQPVFDAESAQILLHRFLQIPLQRFPTTIPGDIQHDLAGVWWTISRTTLLHQECNSCNLEK